MAFFNDFPLVPYNFDRTSSTNTKLVVDILLRVKIAKDLQNENLVYYKYDVQDGDTPEIIAKKYYGDPTKHWIILLSNNILDPFYDWPLTTTNLEKVLISKYGSVASSQTTTHHYEKIITQKDSVTSNITTNKYVIDQDTYNSLPETTTEVKNLSNGTSVTITIERKIVTNYDYEIDLNESKRQIKIVDERYMNELQSQLSNFLRNV